MLIIIYKEKIDLCFYKLDNYVSTAVSYFIHITIEINSHNLFHNNYINIFYFFFILQFVAVYFNVNNYDILIIIIPMKPILAEHTAIVLQYTYVNVHM